MQPHGLLTLMSILVASNLSSVLSKFTQNSNGDITVDLNKDFAEKLDPLDTTCAAKKRDDNTVDCLTEGTEELLGSTPIFEWLNEEAAGMDQQIVARNWINPDEDEAFARVLVYTGADLPRRGVPQNRLFPMAEVTYILKLARYYAAVVKLSHFVISAGKRSTKDYSPRCQTGEFQPSCDNFFCQGQNGKCTALEFKGCSCNDNKKCPPDDRIPLCDNCGGDNGVANCKGISDHNNLWQGCKCFVGGPNFPNRPFKDQKSLADAQNYWKDLVKQGPDGKKCFGLGTPTWITYPAATNAAKDFTDDEELITGNGGTTNEYTYNPGTNDMVKLSIKFEGDGSGGHFKIVDAHTGFLEIINGCDADNPSAPNPQNIKHGGTNQYRGTSPLSTLTVQPLAGIPPQIACDPPDPGGLKDQYKVAMRRDSILSSVQDFCKNQNGKDIGKGVDQWYGPFGPGSSPDGFGRQGIHLQINRPGVQTKECSKWDGKVNEDACNRAFVSITDECDTNTVIAKRGGDANYVCGDYKIEGSGGADTFRMHLHQWMERDNQYLEWTLWDSRGKQVGGPSKGPKATGAPYDLGFWVDSPTNRDATNIRMFYPPDPVSGPFGGLRIAWSTGWTGQAGSQSYSTSYFCDDVLDKKSPGYWKPIGAGFEREFDCYFRGWANSDGMAGEPPS